MSGTLCGVVLNSGVEANMKESRSSDFRKIHCELSAKHTNANSHWYYQTFYFIVSKPYQGEGEREGQRENLNNFHICVARLSLHYHNLTLQQGNTPHISHWFSRWFADSQAIIASLDASRVACIFAHAFVLVLVSS